MIHLRASFVSPKVGRVHHWSRRMIATQCYVQVVSNDSSQDTCGNDAHRVSGTFSLVELDMVDVVAIVPRFSKNQG